MSEVFLHKEKNKNILLKLLLTLLIPFILYGFYKNGFCLREKGIIFLLKPVIFLLFSLFFSFIFAILKKEKFINYNLLCNILLSLIIMPNINIITFLIICLILNIINYFTKLNPICITLIIAIIISIVTKKYDFFNIIEKDIKHHYSLIDYLFGKGYGGMGNTFLLASLSSLIILGLNKEYKLNIPISGGIIYYSLMIITCIIKGSFPREFLINNNLIFAYIFIAPISIYSSYSKGAGIIYGTILGLFTYIFSFIDINLGIYLSLFITNICHKFFDKLITGKTSYIEVL